MFELRLRQEVGVTLKADGRDGLLQQFWLWRIVRLVAGETVAGRDGRVVNGRRLEKVLVAPDTELVPRLAEQFRLGTGVRAVAMQTVAGHERRMLGLGLRIGSGMTIRTQFRAGPREHIGNRRAVRIMTLIAAIANRGRVGRLGMIQQCLVAVQTNRRQRAVQFDGKSGLVANRAFVFFIWRVRSKLRTRCGLRGIGSRRFVGRQFGFTHRTNNRVRRGAGHRHIIEKE